MSFVYITHGRLSFRQLLERGQILFQYLLRRSVDCRIFGLIQRRGSLLRIRRTGTILSIRISMLRDLLFCLFHVPPLKSKGEHTATLAPFAL